MATLFETINLEIQIEDCREEHRGEKGVYALFTLRNNFNTVQGVFKKRKISSMVNSVPNQIAFILTKRHIY